IETDVPCRLDRLPWTRFHTLVVVALGITWVLDGLEVTIAGSIAGALEESPVLHFTAAEVGLAASAYLVGAVSGALLFGYLTDRLGRRRLFMVTLGLYLAATAATALSWDFWSFAVFRVLTGAGIGGEYAAINSAIQELIPARYRGRTDLAINGSFWLGAALGALGAVGLLQPGLLLMSALAFFYYSIFFTYALVLTRFYEVPTASIGWYMLPFALGNLLGPLVLGPLFDTLGRRPMIASTYALSGILLAIVGYLFRQNLVDAATLTLCWSGIFFFASAAASAAYLTVSESFPLEARALAIAVFYALGTAIGGVAAPSLFGLLVGSGERSAVFLGYLL